MVIFHSYVSLPEGMSLAHREFPGPKSSVAKATPLAGGRWSKPENQVAHDSFATGAGAWWCLVAEEMASEMSGLGPAQLVMFMQRLCCFVFSIYWYLYNNVYTLRLQSCAIHMLS